MEGTAGRVRSTGRRAAAAADGAVRLRFSLITGQIAIIIALAWGQMAAPARELGTYGSKTWTVGKRTLCPLEHAIDIVRRIAPGRD
jgi:hypothetical protein